MKPLRIGVFGAGRGVDLAKNFLLLGCDVVALCEFVPERTERGREKLGDTVTYYDDFDKFLNHGLDAVIIANYFHEHAPYAIKCFEKNIHVFSECISNGTMAEGVALLRAHEKSKSVYMLAENYPQMIFNRELKRLVDGGTLGKIMYAEGEYNHPGDLFNYKTRRELQPFEKHWRNYLPGTYYVTHSLGPVMRITGATPKRVTAMPIFMPYADDAPVAKCGDRTAVIMTLNDDDSVFRITGCASFGAHHNSYRVCGTKGSAENVRGMDGRVMLRYNQWEAPEGARKDNLYMPDWNDKDEALIKKSGHGGGDYLTARMFVECIREGKQPEHPFDIHSAVTMSSVAILAHRSVLGGGQPYDIPDFHTEEARIQYENDYDSPFHHTDGTEPTVSACSHKDFAPSENQLKSYRKMLETK